MQQKSKATINSCKEPQTRRNYMGKLGAAACSVGFTAPVAGCLGGDDENIIRSTSPGAGLGPCSLYYFHWADYAAEELEEIGYEFDHNFTFDAGTLYAGGNTDVLHVDPYETAEIGQQEDITTTVLGDVFTVAAGLFVRPDSPYTIDETGSPQASLEALAADDAVIGHPGWWSGSILPFRVLMSEVYGLDFDEQGGVFGDFINSDYGSLATQLVEEEFDAVITYIGTGRTHEYMIEDNPPMEEVFNLSAEMLEADLGLPHFNVLQIRDDKASVEVNEALLTAGERATEHVFDTNNPTEEEFDFMGLETQQQFDFMMDYFFNGYRGYASDFAPNAPLMTDEVRIDADWVQDKENFLNNLIDVGGAPQNWEDYISFYTS